MAEATGRSGWRVLAKHEDLNTPAFAAPAFVGVLGVPDHPPGPSAFAGVLRNILVFLEGRLHEVRGWW